MKRKPTLIPQDADEARQLIEASIQRFYRLDRRYCGNYWLSQVPAWRAIRDILEDCDE